jgi:hypothetical protein
MFRVSERAAGCRSAMPDVTVGERGVWVGEIVVFAYVPSRRVEPCGAADAPSSGPIGERFGS